MSLGTYTNKAGYTASSVVCGWARAVFEVAWSFGLERWSQRPQKPQKSKVWRTDRWTDGQTDGWGVELHSMYWKKETILLLKMDWYTFFWISWWFSQVWIFSLYFFFLSILPHYTCPNTLVTLDTAICDLSSCG